MTSYAITDAMADRRITEAVVRHARSEAKAQRERFVAVVLIGLGVTLLIASVLFTGYVGRRDLRDQLVRGCAFTRQQNISLPAYRRRDCNTEYPPARFLPFASTKRTDP